MLLSYEKVMSSEARKFKNSVFFVVSFTLLLWLVKALEWAVALDFGFLGILPRTLSGTMGIITAPLVHGDVLHLISNTFPLLLLGISVFYFYDRIALEVFAWIYFMSGFWVWMAARDAYHIGASGLVYGLVAFLFFSGLFRRDTRSLSISLVVIFLYGGMLQGLFPTNDRISWESHLLGALAGAFCAFFYRDVQLKMGAGRQKMQKEEDSPAMASEAARSYADLQKAADSYPLQAGFFPLPKPARKPPVTPEESGKGLNGNEVKYGIKKATFVYELKESRNKNNSYLFKSSQKAPQWESSSTRK